MTQLLGAPVSVPEAGWGQGLAVDVDGRVKGFGEPEAVAGVTFPVRSAEVFAFLGPNGGGESTTINMLCTLAWPTSGRASVAGFDVVTRPRAAVPRRIGLVFQEQTLDQQLTVVTMGTPDEPRSVVGADTVTLEAADDRAEARLPAWSCTARNFRSAPSGVSPPLSP